jgi:hypothetical protein
MKRFCLKFLTCLVVVGTAVNCLAAPDLDGRWNLAIGKVASEPITRFVIRFTNQTAPSCIGGDWRKVFVEEAQATDLEFFPLHDALSYRIEESEIIIGRNEVCDGYLRLSAKLNDSKIVGEYYAFGIRSATSLGEFTLVRRR